MLKRARCDVEEAWKSGDGTLRRIVFMGATTCAALARWWHLARGAAVAVLRRDPEFFGVRSSEV
jgi:hypothetical protein